MQEDEPRRRQLLLAPFPRNHRDPLTPHPPSPPHNNQPFAEEDRPGTAREYSASHMQHHRYHASSPPRDRWVVE